MDNIHNYYSPNDLYNQILNGLDKLGKDLSSLSIDDLQPVDEFHIRGDKATKELIQLSGFTSDMHILDVGCGIGGSTRRLYHDIGCTVTGIDLSDQYIDTAERLTSLLGMESHVSFKAASALELPFGDKTFDGAWSLQMNMNVEDKLGWLKELYRILKPGTQAVLYEVCAGTQTPVYFPVPWAQDSSMSFLIQLADFKALIQQSGFEVTHWNDRTDSALEAFSQVTKPVGEVALPPLGVHLLVGNDIKTKAYNLRRNLEENRVSLIETLVTKTR